MTADAPMRGHRRGLRRWWWIVPVAVPVAVLLIANLWLIAPPGRAWAAAKIQRRTGMEARVGAAWVWPWTGVSLHEVEILQPAALRPQVQKPFARISSIRLTPVWRSWLRGRREFRAVEIDSPHLFVTVEMLAELAKSQAPQPPTTPPVAAATLPQVGPPMPVSPPPATPPAAAPKPEPVPKAPTVMLPPTTWLHVRDASFILCSAATGKTWLEVSGVSGSIPIAGKTAQSSLRVRLFNAANEQVLNGLSVPMDWSSPLLSIPPFESEIRGVKFTVAAKLGMLGGLPMQIEAQVPRQPLTLTPLPAAGHAIAETIAANARFRGLLLAPKTWQGDLVAETLAPSVSIAGHDATFDRGQSVIVLRGGVISCVDARLIGDELSLLGNATMLADGRVAANLRVVAPPENAAAIAARLFPSVPQPLPLTPLSTPQRAAFDLEAFGNIRQLFLRLGRDGPIVELKR